MIKEKRNMNINFHQFEQLYKNGYTLDMLFLLQEINDDGSIISLINDNMKIEILFQTIVRKGIITEEGKITLSGKELLKSITENTIAPNRRKKIVDDSFDRWWAAFASTDTFQYKGKTFNGSRSLKAKKEDCRIKLKAILNEGEYTIDQMIGALEFEIMQKKENSIRTGINKLSFMQNSCTYLSQKTFESFIELIKEGIEIKETALSGGVDI